MMWGGALFGGLFPFSPHSFDGVVYTDGKMLPPLRTVVFDVEDGTRPNTAFWKKREKVEWRG
jgi:hypothetical protein